MLGLGEVVSWLRLTQGDPDLLARIDMTRKQGKIVHGHTAGAGGLFSLEPWRDVGGELAAVQLTLKERGSNFPKPLYALCFLTFVTLPELRITGRGLVRAKEREIVPLLAD